MKNIIIALLLLLLFASEANNPKSKKSDKKEKAKPQKVVLPDFLNRWDFDGDGQVSFHEWIVAFQIMDLNNDGFVTPEEAEKLVKKEKK